MYSNGDSSMRVFRYRCSSESQLHCVSSGTLDGLSKEQCTGRGPSSTPMGINMSAVGRTMLNPGSAHLYGTMGIHGMGYVLGGRQPLFKGPLCS